MALWTSNAFVEEAQAWVAAQLTLRGSRLTGEWQQLHARVWSSTVRFETTEGRVWFKVNGSGTGYEPALIALLGELRPGLAPDVIARRQPLVVAHPGWRTGTPVLRRSRHVVDVLGGAAAQIRRGATWPRGAPTPPAGNRSPKPRPCATSRGVSPATG